MSKNFTKLLQNELRKKGYLSIDDVIKLSYENGHYLDTARRKLEEDYTPYSEKVMKGNRIKGWRYVFIKDLDFMEKDIRVETPKEQVQEPLFNIRVPLN
jgi:hypothetical protein